METRAVKNVMARAVVAAALFAAAVSIAQLMPPGNSGDDYIVGPKDQIYIGVWGAGDLDIQENVEVSSEGTIPFFYLGEVNIARMTVKEIRIKLTAILADGYYKDPVVVVKIEKYRSKEVIIQGAVADPGTYILESNYITFLRLVSMAGGVADDRGTSAYIYRGGVYSSQENTSRQQQQNQQETQDNAEGSQKEGIPSYLDPNNRVEVDLFRLLDKGDVSYDLIVYPGDFVYVVPKPFERIEKGYVWVEGAVKVPRQLSYQEGLTVLQAVIQAGGFSDYAAPNRSRVNRTLPDGTQQTIRIKLKDIQKGKKPDVPLKPGDRITVPESIF